MTCAACGIGMASGQGRTFHDGSLGMASGPGTAFRGGSLGVAAGPGSAYRSGSLGFIVPSRQKGGRMPGVRPIDVLQTGRQRYVQMHAPVHAIRGLGTTPLIDSDLILGCLFGGAIVFFLFR
jgi:hypothetical protein